MLSCAQFAERGNRALLIEVNQIHYEVIWVEHFDLEVLLQMRRCKICDVERDNRIRLQRHRGRHHVPIFDLHRFEDRRLREF